MNDYSKIKIFSQAEGFSEIHIAGSPGDYATICGMDDTPLSGVLDDISSEFVEGKVTCNSCIAVWKLCRKIKPSEIEVID